jgi:hypothetical protein
LALSLSERVVGQESAASERRVRAAAHRDRSAAALPEDPVHRAATRGGKRQVLLLDDSEEVFFAHHQQLIAIDLDGLAAVLAEQDPVADADVQRNEIALVIALARADGQDFTLIGLFGGVVGDDDSGSGLGFLFKALDDHTIMQRTKFHLISFGFPDGKGLGFWRSHIEAGSPTAVAECGPQLLALNDDEC